MERYAETQRTSGTKSSPSRHLSVPPAGHVLSSVHYCPFFCSFSPPSPAFAFLLFLLPDIPILPSFYAALSLLLLLLLVGFCPCQPPCPTDPLPPLPPSPHLQTSHPASPSRLPPPHHVRPIRPSVSLYSYTLTVSSPVPSRQRVANGRGS